VRVLPGFLAEVSPVMVAPMAGGPSTPTMVAAAAGAGHFAQLAAGYRTATAMTEQIRELRRRGIERFGVNLFVPSPAQIGASAYRAYAEALQPTAQRLGVGPLPALLEDDDDWDAKIAALVDDPVPVVSFTFGLPNRSVLRQFQRVGTITMQTVTSAEEAAAAAEQGIDVLVVQGFAAGGHSGVWNPAALPVERPLEDLVHDVEAAASLPIVATGGLAGAADIERILDNGACAAAVGTAVLRAPESGASTVSKNALADPAFDRTVLTRAFTGRPARALVNSFIRDHDRAAPVGYPALHHLTKPIRAAGTAALDPSVVNLWAGLGWRSASDHALVQTLNQLLPR